MANDNHIKITDVYYVPGVAKHLLSVGQATNNGLTIEFIENWAMIHLHKGKGKAIVCPKQGHLYPVAAKQIEALSTKVCQNHNQDNVSPTYLWHCRFRHIHIQALQECQKQKSVRGLPTVSFETIKVCEGCLYGKMSHKSFSPSNTNTTEPLQLVHSDLCGPFSIPSMSGAKYFITFIDNTTRFTVVSFLKHKAQAFSAFSAFKSLAENQTNHKIKVKVFGAVAYTYIQSKNRSKLENHCTKGRFIGYGDPYGVKAYRIYLPQLGKIVFSRSVKFDEESVICGQVGRSETSSSEGTSCDIFEHMAARREKEIDTTGCRLQRKTLKQHIDASMGKEVDST